jgi:hypothetical protein
VKAFGFFFSRAASLLIQLNNLSPALYGDFPHIAVEPTLPMLNPIDGSEAPWHFSITQLDQLSITQLDQLIRDISHIFKIKLTASLRTQIKILKTGYSYLMENQINIIPTIKKCKSLPATENATKNLQRPQFNFR